VQRNSSYATLASYKTGSSMKNSIKPTVAKPEPKKKGLFSKVGGFLKDAADFLFMDDIRTLADPNASVLDKSIAFISLIPNPFGKAVKGVKLGVDAATSLGRKADDVKAVVKGVEKAGGTKGTGNAPVPTKPGGGSNPKDFVNPHSEKHMYDPSRPSTPNRSQYGEDVDVAKLRQETMTNPDKAYSNWTNPNNPNPNKITKYYKKFDENISTPDTPTGSHRVFENLDDPTRSSHFPYVPRK
ncbi:hypothetical protein, partial [Ornithinibacillus contaminans]|uniref:hypothetical protein n=1 Tax=Ornithinibacillus contaminans TaxID=694055 RepID=UPI000AD1423B